MSQSADTYEIVNGPGAWKWLTSFGFSVESPERLLEFEFMDHGRMPASRVKRSFRAIVSGLKHEDGGDHTWLFEGVATLHGRRVDITGYYNTHDRKGNFTVVR